MSLSYETGALNTLNEVSLTEQIHNDKRRYNHQACCILYYVVIESFARVIRRQGLRNYRINVGHKVYLITGVCEEYGRVELVRPLPRE